MSDGTGYPLMKVRSPIVTLLVGLLIAAVVAVLSVRAHHESTGGYGAPSVRTAVPR
ncbi:MAG TPA: hypothetical protein VHA75_05820 [Rugosimonospora sp.]|nr:hypothetical protein [Rugosimonospora sp.]